MFLDDGSIVCQACFFAADTRKKEESGVKTAIYGGAAMIGFGILLILAVGLLGAGAKMMVLVGGGLLTAGAGSVSFGLKRQKELANKK